MSVVLKAVMVLGLVFAGVGMGSGAMLQMHVNTYTDPFGRQQQTTSYSVPNRGPNGFDQLFGTTAEQAASFAANPVFFQQKPGPFDTIRSAWDYNTIFKTDGGGRIVESCLCPGHGIPCYCNPV